jgi:hypothetical protein
MSSILAPNLDWHPDYKLISFKGGANLDQLTEIVLEQRKKVQFRVNRRSFFPWYFGTFDVCTSETSTLEAV